jgi:hypothetical protein
MLIYSEYINTEQYTLHYTTQNRTGNTWLLLTLKNTIRINSNKINLFRGDSGTKHYKKNKRLNFCLDTGNSHKKLVFTLSVST